MSHTRVRHAFIRELTTRLTEVKVSCLRHSRFSFYHLLEWH